MEKELYVFKGMSKIQKISGLIVFFCGLVLELMSVIILLLSLIYGTRAETMVIVIIAIVAVVSGSIAYRGFLFVHLSKKNEIKMYDNKLEGIVYMGNIYAGGQKQICINKEEMISYTLAPNKSFIKIATKQKEYSFTVSDVLELADKLKSVWNIRCF